MPLHLRQQLQKEMIAKQQLYQVQELQKMALYPAELQTRLSQQADEANRKKKTGKHSDKHMPVPFTLHKSPIKPKTDFSPNRRLDEHSKSKTSPERSKASMQPPWKNALVASALDMSESMDTLNEEGGLSDGAYAQDSQEAIAPIRKSQGK